MKRGYEDLVLDYLRKTSGEVHLSKLSRELNIPKSSLHNVINELERKGVVKTTTVNGRRYIILNERIPRYVINLVLITILAMPIALFSFISSEPSFVIHLSSSDSNQCCGNGNTIDVSLIIVTAITTYWIAFATLRKDDFMNTVRIVRRRFLGLLNDIERIVKPF